MNKNNEATATQSMSNIETTIIPIFVVELLLPVYYVGLIVGGGSGIVLFISG